MELNQILPKTKKTIITTDVNVSEVARLAGVSRATFYRLVNDGPDNLKMANVRAIAKALGYKMVISFEPVLEE